MKASIVHNKKKGFTLVETLVALFLLTTAIGAAMYAAQTGLRSSYYARDEITASYLGIEAVEYIRNIRDHNQIAKKNWLNGGSNFNIEQCIDQKCTVDPLNGPYGTIEVCGGTCPKLRFDGTFYHHANTPESKESHFRRTVEIRRESNQKSGNHEIAIAVTVTWQTGSFAEQKIIVRENLFDW
jgi:prepilin-type N-terminal cleavage/methylation domain-containing protein